MIIERFTHFLSTRKRFIIIGIILLAVFLIIKQTGVLGKNQTKYKTEKITRSDLKATITVSGTVQANNLATMTFLSTGRVGTLYFQEGQSVFKGDLVAVLDQTEARINISKAEATLASAESDLNKVFDDIRLFRYTNDATGETMTQKNTREEAEKARDIAYQSLQTAKKQLEWTSIIAPFDGVVSQINNISVMQNITPTSSSSVVIVGDGGLKFVANVDETDFGKLVPGLKGEITLDAYPDQKFPAEISKIGISAIKLSTGGSVIPVDLLLSNDNRLKNGLNGEVNFVVWSKENVLAIPRTAVRKDNQQQYVYILEKNQPIRKNIQVGETIGSRTEIRQGLSENELVILGDVIK